MNKLELSLVLPVHNQETIIKSVVRKIVQILEKAKIKYEIILVENGSSDNTLTVVDNLAKEYKNIRSLNSPKGYGSAILTGLDCSKGKFVSYMPSDGQLDPNLLLKLFKLIKTGKYDLVKIKRTTRESLIRTFRSKVFNFLSRLLFKIPVSDINGSPRVFSRKWLPILDLQYKDSFIDTEMAIKAYLLKWKIKEIPAKTLPRLGGKSTVNINTVIEFLRNLIFYRFGSSLKVWRKRKIKTDK
ncbi:MAG: glycosyltransferase family 2 protein [Candidatus Omnitrophica bacterium]|nr:glycosyltransferase family 2 protein [Candidatus Omnitrophota bacterium]